LRQFTESFQEVSNFGKAQHYEEQQRPGSGT
jgi:hypothetical protein